MHERDSVRALTEDLINFLEYMRFLGCEQIPLVGREERMRQIEDEIRSCRACALAEYRTNVVPGEGNLYARIMFVGEGPGEEEDKQGRPFVGRAGELLTKMIKAMGLERKDVYIANVVKCRPPNNRNPLPEEESACMPYLERQISTIQPEVIITLGNVPTKALLHTSEGITKVRGTWHEFNGIPVMPTFHPSYLLRHEPAKRYAWEDLKQVMRYLRLPLPRTSKRK